MRYLRTPQYFKNRVDYRGGHCNAIIKSLCDRACCGVIWIYSRRDERDPAYRGAIALAVAR